MILITGANGQDGSILAHKLYNLNVEFVAICNLNSNQRAKKFANDSNVFSLDLSKADNLNPILERFKPNYIYNFAGTSNVANSNNEQYKNILLNSALTSYLIDWCLTKSQKTRLLQASSSEIFGSSRADFHNENSLHCPNNTYGISRSCSFQLIKNARENQGLYAVNAILFNHESPLRPSSFILKKIVSQAVALKKNYIDALELGNTQMKRDLGWAPDYVEGMYRQLNYHSPEDFTFATGKLVSIQDMITETFEQLGLESKSASIKTNKALFRQSDNSHLKGDSSKAQSLLHWKNTKNLSEIIHILIENEEKLQAKDYLEFWFLND